MTCNSELLKQQMEQISEIKAKLTGILNDKNHTCLLYTSDAADD